MPKTYTKQDLMNDLEKAGINKKGTLLVHASLKSIGAVEGGGETVIAALCEYMKDGLLVIPCHTWSTVNTENPVFNAKKSPSCIGVLPELFRKTAGVARSLHPTHSLCARGKDAVDFLRGQERFDTPCAPDSCYGVLAKRNADVLLIGVDFGRNTSIHCIEEVANVPTRIKQTAETFVVIDETGTAIDCPSYRHDNANSDLYVKLEPVMKERGQLREVSFGAAKCLSFKQTELFETTLELLKKDIHLFDDDKPIPKELY